MIWLHSRLLNIENGNKTSRKCPIDVSTLNLAPLFSLLPSLPETPLRCIHRPHCFRWCWCWCHRPPPSIPVHHSRTAIFLLSVPRPDLSCEEWAAQRPPHPRCLLVWVPAFLKRVPRFSTLRPLPPVSPPPLPHAAYWRTAPIWRSITPSATAEAQNPPPSRRMLHVWTRWGKGCCRLTKQVDVYRK